MASEVGPADFRAISMLADGINHAVPTHKELQESITWLLKNKMVQHEGRKYYLTTKGKVEIELSRKDADNLIDIWNKLDHQLVIF